MRRWSSAASGGRGERAGGEDGDGVGIVLVERGDLFAVDGDAGFGGDALGDAAGELDAVDGEGVAGGDGGGVGFGEEDGAGAAHLLLEQPGGGVFGLGLEGVGADELGEVGWSGGLRWSGGAHLVEVDVAAERGGLERGFGTGEAAADDFDSLCWCVLPRYPPPPTFSAKSSKQMTLGLDFEAKVLILLASSSAKSSI